MTNANAEYQRTWWQANKEVQRARIKANKLKIHEWLVAYRMNLTCSRCPESHPDCLDFHHRDASLKIRSISAAARTGWSKERLLKEIEKCDVLCANCHRKLHASVA